MGYMAIRCDGLLGREHPRQTREADGVGNSLIEIDIGPANLAGQQLGNSGLAAAHKSSEADEPARTNFADHQVGSA